MNPLWPRLDPVSGLPRWVRADLRALPEIPVRPAGRTGAAAGRPPAGRGRVIATVGLAICAWLLVPIIRGSR